MDWWPSRQAAKSSGGKSFMTLDYLLSLLENKISSITYDDFSFIIVKDVEDLIRFSNNEITVFATTENISIEIYMGKDKKRTIGETTNLDEQSISNFINLLSKQCADSPINNDYTSLPPGPFNYDHKNMINDELSIDHESMIDHVEVSINSALKAGASRVSGSFTSSKSEILLKTSNGTELTDKYNTNLLNLRAFSTTNSSGHGLSCSSSIRDIDSENAGIKAGEYAKLSINPKNCDIGKYDILFTPTVAADIFQHVGYSASAFSVDAGTSFLTNKINEKVSSDKLSITDVGNPINGIYGRIFDNEGMPTKSTTIIKNGFMKSYLHNITTSNKYNVESTGNAGIIDPSCWNLDVSSGDMTFDEQLSSIKNGLLITNNWYTRFQNQTLGLYSTIPRDACFVIKNGEISDPIHNIRISDNLPRQLLNIESLSKQREWIKWWEVEIPTLSPSVIINNVPITRSM